MQPTFTLDHIERMSDSHGLFEHAEGTVRRIEHGYCTDDNARLLVVASRESDEGMAHHFGRLALQFVIASQDANGMIRNRMDSTGRWTDRATTDDCWGRALWGLGVASAEHDDPTLREDALAAFETSAWQRSGSRRSMAFAALGAADVALKYRGHRVATSLLIDAVDTIGPLKSAQWPWPEARLTYANAALAEAVIAAGSVLDNSAILDRGLEMLRWLLATETANGHLSVVGTAGRGPGEVGPQFDQQPIEVAAMADACWRAHTVTEDSFWLNGIALSQAWFAGDNDAALDMHDGASGGGFDGLQRNAVNLNQGAESTLALLSTLQRARAAARMIVAHR